MLTTRHVIRVEPSRCQQWVLIVCHLVLGALLWDGLQGGYAYFFWLLLLLSLGHSLYLARRCRFEMALLIKSKVGWSLPNPPGGLS